MQTAALLIGLSNFSYLFSKRIAINYIIVGIKTCQAKMVKKLRKYYKIFIYLCQTYKYSLI